MTLRVAVIGVGHLGKHHARILSSLPGVELVAVVDTNRRARRGDRGGERHAGRCSTTATCIGQVDAVTHRRADRAAPRASRCRFCDAGIRVLVEKPMARSLDEADEMIDAAGDADVVLAVGHTERFNPASTRRGRCSPIRASSKSTGSARFPSAASTSTSSST